MITDPNEYDSYLQEALASLLAADLAYAITNNATLAKNYEATADERLREARFIDATENSLGTVKATNLQTRDYNATNITLALTSFCFRTKQKDDEQGLAQKKLGK